MDHDSTLDPDVSLAAHAFGELRAEISLLRRAVERLTDERTSQPDYAPTLEAIAKRLEDVCVWAKKVSEQPAMRLTPETLASAIDKAAGDARSSDRRMLESATAAINTAAGRIDAMIARSQAAGEQDRELLHNRIAFAVAGMVTFAILPGAIARSLPASWAVPERIAARTLGTDMWSGGQRMMRRANPDRWNEIVDREKAHTQPTR
ncbi:DUF6118 family protein [Sphingomonas sp. HF-S3]|uniref:DUF6118 family protein n=1 Tax=Sphingomonas rustica TaxID=3103142 RepID=A0ABV0BBI8_9SPHN